MLARWCKLGGLIDTSGSDLRPGVVDYFLKQNIKVGNQYVTCILATNHWFQSHPDRHSIGAPVEVWCKNLFELELKEKLLSYQFNESMESSSQLLMLLGIKTSL